MSPSVCVFRDDILNMHRRLHTSRMSLSEDVDLEEFVTTKDDLSGADIKAICTEAGLLALRERRMRVTKADFTEAREKVNFTTSSLHEDASNRFWLGDVSQERGHARGSLLVIQRSCTLAISYVFSALFYAYSPAHASSGDCSLSLHGRDSRSEIFEEFIEIRSNDVQVCRFAVS